VFNRKHVNQVWCIFLLNNFIWISKEMILVTANIEHVTLSLYDVKRLLWMYQPSPSSLEWHILGILLPLKLSRLTSLLLFILCPASWLRFGMQNLLPMEVSLAFLLLDLGLAVDFNVVFLSLAIALFLSPTIQSAIYD